jgi:hypothetical protein
MCRLRQEAMLVEALLNLHSLSTPAWLGLADK